MKNPVPMWLKGLCVPRAIAKLLSVSLVLSLGASGQGVNPTAVSLWRQWMVNRDITGPRLYMWADREILQTSPANAQFQNGSYAFMLADGGVPDIDGDLDGHTDGQEIAADGPGDPNDIDSTPTDSEGRPLTQDANILVSLADNSPLRLANSTRAALNGRASLVNPYSGNSVRISAAPGDSRLQRPAPLTDYSTQFYFTNPSSGFSELFRLSLYYKEKDFPNPADANSLETTITPGGYQVEFPPIANPILRAGLTAAHRLVPNGSLTIGMKRPSWLLRSLSTIERFDRPPVQQSWVNGRLKFDPDLTSAITWDDLIGTGLASTADRIRLWVEDESGALIWGSITLNIATPSANLVFKGADGEPLYGSIEDHLGSSFSTLSKNGFIVFRYERTGNGATTADLSWVTLRIPVQMAVSFTSWRNALFSGGDALNDSISGPNADPDNDGLTNQQEFDAGSDPNTPNIGISGPFSESITTNSATLGATVEADPFAAVNVTIIERGVVYSASSTNPFPLIDGPGVNRIPSSPAQTGTFTVSLTGLTDNTQYSYSAYVITDQGTFYTAPVSTFTTVALPPLTLPTVTTLTSNSVTATTANLGATVISDGGTSITEAGVVYSRTSANDNPFIGGASVVRVTGVAGTGPFTVNVTGLTPSTTYSFRAYAINSFGTSHTTAIGTFTTPATPTAPVITAPTVANIAATSATLGGNVTNSGGPAILQRGVVFSSTNTNPSIGGAGVTAFSASTASIGVFTVNATGLQPGTLYRYKAYAINSVGTSYTAVGTFTTLATLPTVTSPTLANVTSSSATLGANITSTGQSAILERGFVYSPTSVNGNPIVGGPGVIKVTAPGTTTGTYQQPITGLSANTGYTFKAFARNSIGTAYGAPYAFFTTLPPLTVTTPTVTDITATTATLGGTVQSDGGTTATARGVVFNTDPNVAPVIGGPGVGQVTGSGTMGVFTVPVSGLAANTDYYFRAYATNSAGTSYSAISSFKTLPVQLLGLAQVQWVPVAEQLAGIEMLSLMSASSITEPAVAQAVSVPEFVYLKHAIESADPLNYQIEVSTDFKVWQPIDENQWQVENTPELVRARWKSTTDTPPSRTFFRVTGSTK